MDIVSILSDSLAYAQEALIDKWVKWAIFIILAIPMSLIQFVINPKTIMTGSTVNWAAIPWAQIAVLSALGFFLSFFISGYIVRIYRGIKPAPEFTEWADLFFDGIRLTVVWLLWFLPLIIVLASGVAIVFVSSHSLRSVTPNITLLLGVLLTIFLELVLLVVVVFFGILGAIRFARTGSIREGIRVSKILARIQSMGWLSYILSLLVAGVAAIIYIVITAILSVLPFIGWIVVLIVSPIFTVFIARYFTLIYEQGEPRPVLPGSPG